ncbi:hypothetical protein RUM44_010661 [Polyplax serrata]|uniref:CUB domain-containing protein n=1 Tax=Polyplax serrata TaxID=468196 RepID=A0ABR1AMT9_POLSC
MIHQHPGGRKQDEYQKLLRDEYLKAQGRLREGGKIEQDGIFDLKRGGRRRRRTESKPNHCNKTVEIYEDVTSPEVTPENHGKPMLCSYRFRSFRGTPKDWILRIRFKKFKVGVLVNATTCDGGYMQIEERRTLWGSDTFSLLSEFFLKFYPVNGSFSIVFLRGSTRVEPAYIVLCGIVLKIFDFL